MTHAAMTQVAALPLPRLNVTVPKWGVTSLVFVAAARSSKNAVG